MEWEDYLQCKLRYQVVKYFKMKDKVILVYRDIEGEIAQEIIWVQKSNEYFKVDNIPFYAPNLALNDIISVEVDQGELYFDELIQASGHSTLQIVFFDDNCSDEVLKYLENFECSWEGMKNEPYYSIDIPPHIDYSGIKSYLIEQRKVKILDFQEACLSDNHN